MTTEDSLEVAWVELNTTQDRNYPNHQSCFPTLDCSRFSVDDQFRAAFCKHHYDAVLIVCNVCSEPSVRATIEWIRSVRCSKIPVLVLTDNNNESSVAEVLYAGADDVQRLPVLPAILNARVQAICKRAAMAQALS